MKVIKILGMEINSQKMKKKNYQIKKIIMMKRKMIKISNWIMINKLQDQLNLWLQRQIIM